VRGWWGGAGRVFTTRSFFGSASSSIEFYNKQIGVLDVYRGFANVWGVWSESGRG
jgi:hypothetical protein